MCFYKKDIKMLDGVLWLWCVGAIRKQLAAFLEGFYEIIPKRLISIFTEQELELLISGLPTIDIDDLKANTEYHKYQSSSIQVWMSRCVLNNLSTSFLYFDLQLYLAEVLQVWSHVFFNGVVCGPHFFSSYSDSVVLEGFAVLWPGRQGQVSSVCHRHIQGSPPGIFCPWRHERHPEVSDSQRRSLHWPLTIRSYLVWTWHIYKSWIITQLLW